MLYLDAYCLLQNCECNGNIKMSQASRQRMRCSASMLCRLASSSAISRLSARTACSFPFRKSFRDPSPGLSLSSPSSILPSSSVRFRSTSHRILASLSLSFCEREMSSCRVVASCCTSREVPSSAASSFCGLSPCFCGLSPSCCCCSYWMVSIFSPEWAREMVIFSMECVLESSRSTSFLYFSSSTFSFSSRTLMLTSPRCFGCPSSCQLQSSRRRRFSSTRKSLKFRTLRIISSHFSRFSLYSWLSFRPLFELHRKNLSGGGGGDLGTSRRCGERLGRGEYLMGEQSWQKGLLGERTSRKGERDLEERWAKMEAVRRRGRISMLPILLLILCSALQMTDSKLGFEYIEGDDELPGFALAQLCCGKTVGCCKAWVPCLGCFCCCCNNPYVSVPQGSKGLLLSFKKYQRTCGPGLHFVNPVAEELVIVDCRISVALLPAQRLMTRDNVSITVDSCLYYHVVQPHLTYFRVDNVEAALIKATGGIIKNTVAAFTFQELLEKKAAISEDVENQVKPIIKDWGIAVDSICLKNFGISADLERELVSAPIARRNAESKIINAKGQVEIAKLLGERSKILDSKTAIQVRYLETLKGLARNSTSRMIYRSF